MIISQIVAVSKNFVIGVNNKLPWNLPADTAYFKRVTMGHHIITGRKNYESEGHALPGRTNIIVTRNKNYKARDAIIVHSMDDAIEICKNNIEDEVFIVGGGEIYKQTLPITNRLYITIIDTEVQGDVYFPRIDFTDWNILSERKYYRDEKNKYDHTYYVLERKNRKSN